jgi:hypothetical protein
MTAPATTIWFGIAGDAIRSRPRAQLLSKSGPDDVAGQYNAEVSDAYGPQGFLYDQEVVVLADSPNIGTVGSAAGDEPPVGSVLDTTNFGGGFENIYSDLVGLGLNGSNAITDTWVTPFGDFTGTTLFDAAGIDALNNDYSYLLCEALDLLPKFLGGI